MGISLCFSLCPLPPSSTRSLAAGKGYTQPRSFSKGRRKSCHHMDCYLGSVGVQPAVDPGAVGPPSPPGLSLPAHSRRHVWPFLASAAQPPPAPLCLGSLSWTSEPCADSPPLEAGFRKGTGPPHFRPKPVLPGRRFILVIPLPLLSSKGFPGARTSRAAILLLVPSSHASIYWVGPALQQSGPLLAFPWDIYLVSP